MAGLTIDLQEGFDDDRVAVTLDGATVFQKDDVRTRNQIGLAEKLSLNLAAGRHTIGISLPERGAHGEIEIDADATPNLAVSFENGELVLKPAAEAFGYL